MVDVSIMDVIKEEKSNGHLVLLTDDTGRVLTIFVGPPEAMAIAAGMRKSEFPRPMTYDLVCNLLNAAEVKVVSADISARRQATFYATIRILAGGAEKAIDARPSDAMALAVRLGTPIRVAEEVMETASVQAPEVGRSAQGKVAMLTYVNEKLKAVAAERGWSIPDLLANPDEVRVRSLLSDS